MGDVAVIIPAAGSGRRFGAGENKIFQPLRGRAVFLRTCERFAGRDDVGQILLTAAPQDRPRLEAEYAADLERLRVTIIDGGPVRTESVRNALAAVHADMALVAVHDAVRPCVADAWISAVFADARATGAAMLAWPVCATLKRVDEADTIRGTVDRTGLWEAQTPQVFHTHLLRQAYAAASGAATDDAALVEAIGHSVRVVRGDPRNIKITAPADLKLAEAIWDSIPWRPAARS